jgi:uncharacterized protein YlxP (DUF503 family)
MAVGVCTIYLDIPANHSLKGKRRVLKSLMARVRKDFNVSIAEVDHQDVWQTATLSMACVAGDRDYAHGLLTKAVQAILAYRLDATVRDFEIEIY